MIKKHNWTKETMGECAKVHMEQLLDCHFNMVNGKNKQKKLDSLMKSYLNISKSLDK